LVLCNSRIWAISVDIQVLNSSLYSTEACNDFVEHTSSVLLSISFSTSDFQPSHPCHSASNDDFVTDTVTSGTFVLQLNDLTIIALNTLVLSFCYQRHTILHTRIARDHLHLPNLWFILL